MILCWIRYDGDILMIILSIINYKGFGNIIFLVRFDFYFVFIVYFVFYILLIRVFFLNNIFKFIIRYILKVYRFLVGVCV